MGRGIFASEKRTKMMKKTTTAIQFRQVKNVIFLLTLLACLSPWVNAAEALFAGIIIAWLGIVPLEKYSGPLIRYCLQMAVVGLGFGINLQQAVQVGKEGFLLTVCSVFITLGLGIFLGKKIRLTFDSTLLIAAGTAICGGSAIAAIAPLIAAKKEDISVSLGIIFLLNAVALLIFPWLGRFFQLSQHQFGLWSAIAIQDTSSVVAAAASYGNTALEIATTVKLERALWIIPVSLVCLFLLKRENESGDNFQVAETAPTVNRKKQKVRIPWFIGVFLVVIVLSSYFPSVQQAGSYLLPVAKKLLSLTLFFIGTGFTRSTLRKVGFRPLLLGLALWIFIGTLSLIFLLSK